MDPHTWNILQRRMSWQAQWNQNWEHYLITVKLGDTLRISLEEMVHQQPLTPGVIDSTTRDGFVNDNIRQWKPRSIGMRFYWVRDRARQGHYLVYWERGKDNSADYFTKKHPTKHHHSTRGTYIVPTADSSKHTSYQVPINLIGCVKPPSRPGNGWRTDKVFSSYDRTKYGRIQTGH